MMMSKFADGYWNVKKEKINKKYPFLSDKDLNFQEGKEREITEVSRMSCVTGE